MTWQEKYDLVINNKFIEWDIHLITNFIWQKLYNLQLKSSLILIDKNANRASYRHQQCHHFFFSRQLLDQRTRFCRQCATKNSHPSAVSAQSKEWDLMAIAQLSLYHEAACTDRGSLDLNFRALDKYRSPYNCMGCDICHYEWWSHEIFWN